MAAYTFELTGGALCLDFANTLGDRPRSSEEHLAAFADLVAWGEQSSALTATEASALQRWATRHPRNAAEALDEAKEVRETVYRIFSELAAGRAPMPEDLSILNRWLGESMRHVRVQARAGDFTWTWDAGAKPDRVLWPVVRSAAELLVSAERGQLRECQSDVCSWLFVDRSRTKGRRWCSMRTCGNRAKVRRFHERKRREAKQ
jgi:predicted RNA-binding Zn ribbon-like protein